MKHFTIFTLCAFTASAISLGNPEAPKADQTKNFVNKFENYEFAADGTPCKSFWDKEITDVPVECVYDYVCTRDVVDYRIVWYEEPQDFSREELQPLSPGQRYDAVCTSQKSAARVQHQ